MGSARGQKKAARTTNNSLRSAKKMQRQHRQMVRCPNIFSPDGTFQNDRSASTDDDNDTADVEIGQTDDTSQMNGELRYKSLTGKQKSKPKIIGKRSDRMESSFPSQSSLSLLPRNRTLAVSDEDEKNKGSFAWSSRRSNDKKEETATVGTIATSPTTSSNHSLADDVEIDDFTQQMGKLWWPTSNEDLIKTHVRDRYGRLMAAKKPEASTDNTTSSHSSRRRETTAHKEERASAGEGEPKFVGDDTKLKASMALATTIDKVWSKELYEMNAKEREDTNNEIHGVQSTRSLKETPESIEEAINSFRLHIEGSLYQELDNGDSIVPPVTKDAFRRAVYGLGSSYVLSKAFLLKFLRICRYDRDKATLRYFRYLDLLQLLFGDVGLTRPLALKDLTKREMRYLKKGQMQLLPSRDRTGRRIYAFSGCDDYDFNIREKYRTNIYLIDVLSEDVQTQKLGAVSLNAPRVKPSDHKHPFGFEGMTLRMGKQELLGGKYTEAQFFRKINEAVPIRFSAIHYFAPRTVIYNIGKAIILSLLGKDHRKIVRFHAGSHLECMYSLRSFGIPHDDITITEGNNIKTKNVHKLINARQTIEAHLEVQQERRWQQQRLSPAIALEYDQEEECPGIECPGVDCVVFGDKSMHASRANIEFRGLLRAMIREREEKLLPPTSPNERIEHNVQTVKQFIEKIIETARSPEHNLRFMVFEKNKHVFVEIKDHQQLCKRVSQAVRDQRKRTRIEEQRPARAESRDCDSSTAVPNSHRFNGNLTPSPNYCVSSSSVLDEAEGSSMMGKDAVKRMRASHSSESSGSSCSNNIFCNGGKNA